ncbi:MAG TPA: helix-turn-helix domain-containing protein [Solirubrobacterales bacterium]|nr:helix-turn-helix domain-containing protein [Solirubrobacterales bacterium]
MEKSFLEDCLTRDLSLDAIGELVGRHPSTIGYWLKKHGLEASGAARHAPKGGIDREYLEALVAGGLTLREIAETLDRSPTTIRHWLAKFDLKAIRGQQTCVVRDSARIERRCLRHGNTEFVLEGCGYYRCRRCRAEAAGRRRQVVKRKLVEEAGGCCIICGYSRCQRALQFHHLDPATKKFHIGHGGHTRALSRARAEAKKCALLCANCHAEVEAGLTAMPLNSKDQPIPR